jgi:ABC-type Fe3+ transport system permease subunit
MVAKAKKPVGHHDRFDWYSLYVYAISLITILICLFSLVAIVRGVVDAVWPDMGYFDPYAVKNDTGLTQEEIRQGYLDQAIKSIVTSFATLIVAGPLYLYHWNLAKRRRSEH